MRSSRRINLLCAVAFISFVAFSCQIEKSKIDAEYTELEDGFYYLNGTDAAYKVKRKDINESYVLNPEPIFEIDDYESANIMEEDNGMYSLQVILHPLKTHKWQRVLESSVHYVGLVSNHRLASLIKIKGENARNDLYLKCLSENEEEVEVMKKALMPYSR